MSIFIPSDAIRHLDEYKYQSEDRSLVTKYILKPFWLKFERIFPIWMAPNMVTLLGLMFIIISDLLVLIYDPNLESISPKWVYFYHAFAVFMYQTFDACDGIHARRTGQSSPLGELFDHCCDAMNTTLMQIQFASVAGLTCNPLIFIFQYASLATFYISTWEEFYTHKLFLSEISGPVEGLLMLATVYILAGIFGIETLFKMELFDISLPFINKTYTITTLMISIFLGFITTSFSMYSAANNVVNTLTKEKRLREINPAIRNIQPFNIYYATVALLLFFNPSIIYNYTISMVITIGATISFVVGRIITGHLTKQKFPTFNLPTFIPMIQLILLYIIPKLFDIPYIKALDIVVYSGLGLSIAIYGMFVTEIIYDITTYLDIYALSIKHPQIVKDE
ncbi:hypothetical protein CANINC_002517 [Pichia inconspicua]|uniref:Aminoalcoholphosphotransferase n=1 Tax=Pichia inconspicua TaxID=52247 RepID=A0A4T0X266_9ASCO|nr:hypothetical protein CANINC_002517 [[Candida] inconspicua]